MFVNQLKNIPLKNDDHRYYIIIYFYVKMLSF